MQNSSLENPRLQQPWSPDTVAGQEPEQSSLLLQWWYDLTTPPRAPANASYVRREVDRKSRLFSAVAFFFLLTMFLFAPASLFMHIAIFSIVISLIVITAIALWINRSGRSLLAGVVMVLASEAALGSAIQVMTPLDAASIQLYDLYVIIELLAVSLLPARSVFVVATLHSIYICVDLAWLHARMPGLDEALQTQLIPALVRPVGLQLLVAGVAFIWVYHATKAIERANRAEMVASLEHTLAEQRLAIEHEKRDLEESIQQLVKAHVDVTNGQLTNRIPYPPAKVLWPLVGVFNSLWVRLQRTQQIERELQQLKSAIASYAELMQKAASSSRHPLPSFRTGTDLDPLLLSFKKVLNMFINHNNERGGGHIR